MRNRLRRYSPRKTRRNPYRRNFFTYSPQPRGLAGRWDEEHNCPNEDPRDWSDEVVRQTPVYKQVAKTIPIPTISPSVILKITRDTLSVIWEECIKHGIPKKVKRHLCRCPSLDLFRYGCQCGGRRRNPYRRNWLSPGTLRRVPEPDANCKNCGGHYWTKSPYGESRGGRKGYCKDCWSGIIFQNTPGAIDDKGGLTSGLAGTLPRPRRNRRNPIGLGFAVDYWAMLDALNKVSPGPWLADYQELHHQLDRAGYRLRASQFSQIFSDTVSPPGEEPSTTDIYQDIEKARRLPLATSSHDLLDFVDKLRIVIQTLDRTFVRNQRVLGPIVTSVQRFVDNMLTRVHNEQPVLDGSQVTAVSNMERFRTELTTLNPVNLTLSGLNDFIRQLQPTQPFGYSVMMIYQGLDPSLAQQKTMEFMGLLTQMSDAINPFSQELAGNEELTGWKYLHVKPGRHPRRRNPLDTSGMICDFCGKAGVTHMHTTRPMELGGRMRFQHTTCAECSEDIQTRNIRKMVTDMTTNLGRRIPRRVARKFFRDLVTKFLNNILDTRELTPAHVFELHMIKAASKEIKCSLRSGHPSLGDCAQMAVVEVYDDEEWVPSCNVCAATTLGVDSLADAVGDPNIRPI